MQRFLFGAQDQGMTGGDYVFFSYSDQRTSSQEQPWLDYNMTGEILDTRIEAFAAVKQVQLNKTKLLCNVFFFLYKRKLSYAGVCQFK